MFSERRAITHVCGHTEEFWRLEGFSEARDAKAAELAKQKCFDCRIADEAKQRRRVGIQRILKDPAQRADLLQGACQFINEVGKI